MIKSFSAIITKEDEIYVAECPEVSVVSQGGSLFEAVDNLKEAVELYLSEFPLNIKNSKPILTTFEVEIDAIAS